MMLSVWTALSALTAERASAGFGDRLKDIYYAPERVEELQDAYAESMRKMDEQLEAQRAQLEESRRQVDELLRQQELLADANEAYRSDNAALEAQNEQLLGRMEKLEADRDTLVKRILLSVGAIAGLWLLYGASIRVWRYLAWRRQRGEQHEAMLR